MVCVLNSFVFCWFCFVCGFLRLLVVGVIDEIVRFSCLFMWVFWVCFGCGFFLVFFLGGRIVGTSFINNSMVVNKSHFYYF